MTIKSKLSAMAALAVLLLSASSVLSADTGKSSEKKADLKTIASRIKSSCGSDIEKFCKDVTPGEGRVASCLDSKSDQLSGSCKTAWADTKTQISKRMDRADVAFRKSCGADVQKFCSEVPSGGGRLLECLGDHEENLSNSCKDFQAKLDQKLGEFLG